jgi:hypothetical protein
MTPNLPRIKRLELPSRAFPTDSGWIPLPGFDFQMEVPDREDAIKVFIKTMFRLASIATAAAFSEACQETQFVMLCKWFRKGPIVVFRSFVPHPGVVEFMQSQLPPQGSSASLNRLFEGSGLNVQHKYALPMDVLCPVVFVYRPAERHMFLGNENHFSNPEQFLSPNACRTTSGFLNFLGALSLLQAKDKNASKPLVINNVEDLVGAGLDEWLRWMYRTMERGTSELGRIRVKSNDPEQYIYDDE